jgi:WD40 repeat protein
MSNVNVEQINRSGSFDRHRGPVTCAAAVPGSDLVVTSAYDGAVGLFDLGTGRVELLGYHDHLANRVTVNAAGTRVASSSSDFNIHLWDLPNRKLERVLRGHADDVEDFAFVDDHTGVSVSRDWRILVWNLDTGAITRVIEGHDKDVLSVVHDDGRIYTSGDDMTLRVWDLASGRQLRVWGPFENETDTCAIDPIHRRAVLGDDDGYVRLFDIDSGEPLRAIEAHASGIKKVATCPRTGDILSAAYDQKVEIWDARTLERKATLESVPGRWERSFNWSTDGTRLLAGTFDGTVVAWDAASGRKLGELGRRGPGNRCLNDVSANERGELALVADDGIVRMARLTPGDAAWGCEVEPASGRVLANAVALDDERGRVLTGAHDHRLHFYDRSGDALRPVRETPLGEGPINCLRVAHHPGFEGEVFAACYSGAIVRVGTDGEPRGVIRVHEGAVKALSLHARDALGVSCGADMILVAWDFDGNRVERFLGHMAIIDDVDISPSGELVASVSRDFTLKVYGLRDGKLHHSIGIGRRSPKAVCFADDRTVVVTNYWGSLLRVDLDTETVLQRQIAKNGISAITHSGEDLIAVSYDGTAYRVRASDLEVLNELTGMQQRLQPSPMF